MSMSTYLTDTSSHHIYCMRLFNINDCRLWVAFCTIDYLKIIVYDFLILSIICLKVKEEEGRNQKKNLVFYEYCIYGYTRSNVCCCGMVICNKFEQYYFK